MLKVGEVAPDFNSMDQRGQSIRLYDLTGRGPVVLYFYPNDFTPVCTREACHFRDAYDELRGCGAEIVGVSTDEPESHQRFAERYRLGFPLVTDEDRAIARSFDALQLFGLGTKRVTYVIDDDNIVRGVFHHEIRAKKHVDDVRALLAELNGASPGTS